MEVKRKHCVHTDQKICHKNGHDNREKNKEDETSLVVHVVVVFKHQIVIVDLASAHDY